MRTARRDAHTSRIRIARKLVYAETGNASLVRTTATAHRTAVQEHAPETCLARRASSMFALEKPVLRYTRVTAAGITNARAGRDAGAASMTAHALMGNA